MDNICDICGFRHGPNDRYCGRCSVDLREPKGSAGSQAFGNILDEMQQVIKSLLMDAKPKQEKVLKWCGIHALCNSHEMDFPMFFMIALALAQGDRYLGFCDCHLCNQGYRQILAWLAKSKGGEASQLTAESRDVIIRARNTEINGLSFDISKALPKERRNEGGTPWSTVASGKNIPGKITIEVDPGVLEDAVISIMKSERGREIIQSVPREKSEKERGLKGL
jgi:hypothetical protein